MSLENFRSYYLQAMGITQWQLRQTMAEKPFFLIKGFCYQLFSNSSATSYDVLFADVDLKNQSEEQILLQNICKALNTQSQGDCFELSDQHSKELTKIKRIILMGTQVKEWCEKNYFKRSLKQGIQSVLDQDILVTHSPAELLAKPQLKAEVWKNLKTLFER